MSSRLIILPKKSYCPWKPENVQRVLRDQERHRREIEEEAAAAPGADDGGNHDSSASVEHQRERRIAHTRRLQQPQHQEHQSNRNNEGVDEFSGVDRSGGSNNRGGTRHFNLFEAEEQLERSRMIEHEHRTRMLDADSTATVLPTGVHGPSTSNHRESLPTSKPFYLRDNPYSHSTAPTTTLSTHQQNSTSEEAFAAREERRKAQLDPMAAFMDATEGDSPVKKRQRRSGDGSATTEGEGATSTALVVRRRSRFPENGDRDGFSSASNSSSQSESSYEKRRRKKEKRKRKSKKHSRREERKKAKKSRRIIDRPGRDSSPTSASAN